MPKAASLAAAVVILAAVVAVAATPLLDRSAFEAGLFDTLFRFDQSPALTGLGLAVATARPRPSAASAFLVVLGIGLGALLGDRLAAAMEDDAGVARYDLLIGPMECLVVGLALILTEPLRSWILPVAAFCIGAALGLPVIADSGGIAQIEFSLGNLTTAFALIAVPVLVLRPFGWPALAILGRIVGAWLIAIALLLSAQELFGPKL